MLSDTHKSGRVASDPVRLGLVGCGRLAEVGYAAAVDGLAPAEVIAVADPDSARRRALAGRLGARTGREVADHASAEALIAAGGTDAVLIASPPSAHLADARLASAAGLPALVEKPPADTLEAAEALAALEPAPWVGFNRRFQHGRRLLDRIPEKRLELELEIRYRRASWRPHAVDDPALLDLAPHLVDLALLLSGASEAELRSARVSAARVELELAVGPSLATVRCANDRAHRERVIVRTASGRRVAASRAGGPARALIARLPGTEHPLVASLRAQLLAFAGVVRGDDPGVLASAADGVRVMRVIDAAARQAAGERGDDAGGRYESNTAAAVSR